MPLQASTGSASPCTSSTSTFLVCASAGSVLTATKDKTLSKLCNLARITSETTPHQRADAGITAIEAQKSSGSLHGHSQIFIQCVHQHTPLADIMKIIAAGNQNLVQNFLVYQSHVCRAQYADTDAWQEKRACTEDAWPEYRDSLELISRPSYLRHTAREASPPRVEASELSSQSNPSYRKSLLELTPGLRDE